MFTLILGFSISGRASAELLLSQGKSVVAVDRKPQTPMQGVRLLTEQDPIDWGTTDQVVLSPGVPLSHPLSQEAKKRGIETIGEIELAVRHLENRCIGITGTNGKTTSTLLAAHILNASGLPAKALGNIGTALSSYALHPDPEEILVLELSSYQLETLEKKCLDAAVCLNITPDHLDRYKTMDEYARAKCRIEGCLKEGAPLFVSEQVFREYGSFFKNPPYIVDSYNENAVSMLCKTMGVSEERFIAGLKTFYRPKHRIEFVCEINGLTFYNDSKGTNVDAVIYAVDQMEGPVTLLAGGVDKGGSYTPWIEAFCGKVDQMVVFGAAAKKIEDQLKGQFALKRVEKMQDALVWAVKNAQAPRKILLSPGCSSFDEFQNYEHRGNEFKRMIEEKVWIEERRS